MKITIYQLKSNPEIGLSINEDDSGISLWIDEYEGGEAYGDDWLYIDVFSTKEDAFNHIKETYGEVEELKNISMN